MGWSKALLSSYDKAFYYRNIVCGLIRKDFHYEIIAYDNLGNEWMIHSTRKAIEGEIIGLDFTPEDIHIMRLNETEEEFDARIEEYVEMEEPEDGLINAIEEERHEENS